MSERILHYAIGSWLSGILATSVELDVFTHLATGCVPEELARRAGITPRAAAALLEGLHGMGLVLCEAGRYRPAEEATRYLCRGSADDLGPFALSAGSVSLVPLLPLVARAAVERLGLTGAHAVEGVAAPPYDVAIDALAAHLRDPAESIAVFAAKRAALAPGGMLLVADVLLDDDRSGDPWTLAYSCQLVLTHPTAMIHRRCDYADWLRAAGFSELLEEPAAPSPVRLLYAR